MTDQYVVQMLQQIYTRSIMGEFLVIALARVWIFLFVPLLFWLWIYGNTKEKHSVKEALWSAGMSILLGEIIGQFIMRERPFLAISDVISLIPAPLTSSFPSIHTATAVAITAALYFANPFFGAIGIIVTIGIIFGRMSAGVHYPTDIFGGIILGLLCFTIIRLGHKALRTKK